MPADVCVICPVCDDQCDYCQCPLCGGRGCKYCHRLGGWYECPTCGRQFDGQAEEVGGEGEE